MSDALKRLIEAVEGGKATLSQVQDLCLPIWPNSRDPVLYVRIAMTDQIDAELIARFILFRPDAGRTFPSDNLPFSEP